MCWIKCDLVLVFHVPQAVVFDEQLITRLTTFKAYNDTQGHTEPKSQPPIRSEDAFFGGGEVLEEAMNEQWLKDPRRGTARFGLWRRLKRDVGEMGSVQLCFRTCRGSETLILWHLPRPSTRHGERVLGSPRPERVPTKMTCHHLRPSAVRPADL